VAAVFRAIGNQSAGAASQAVAWPVHVAGDLGILVIETGGEGTTLTPPAGWLAVTGSPVTDVASAAGSKLQVWYRFAASAAEANVNTGDSGDHQVARIVTFRGVDPTTPFDATPVTGVKTTASTTVTWDSITTVTNGALIVLIATRPDDTTSVTTFGAVTNANLTNITERGEGGSNAGHGGGFVIVTGTKATAGATGTSTCTTTVSVTNAEITIALRPQPEILPPLLRFDRVNYVRNSAALGSVTGTPGTAPKYWSVVTGAGISSQIVANGIDVNGREYVDIRLFGTGTGSFDNGVYIEDIAPAVIGDPWNGSAFVSLVSGTVPSQFQIVLRELTAGGSLTGAIGNTLSGITGTSSRYQVGRVLVGGATTRAALWLQCSITNAQSIDFTFRVAGPQLSYGSTSTQTYAATYDVVLPRQFHTPTVTQSAASQQIAPALLSEGNTLYTPTATPGAVSRTPALLTETSTLYTPSVSAAAPTQSIAPALLSDGDTLYTPTSAATYSVAPALHTNTSTLYTPSRSTAYSVAPSLHTNSSTLYTPSVAPTTSVAPALLTDGDTLYAPTATPGAVFAAPALLASSTVLYTPSRTTSVSVQPALHTNTNTLYTPTAASKVSVAPALLSDGDTLYAPTSSVGPVSVTPSLLTNTSTLYTPSVSTGAAPPQSVTPSLYTNTSVLYTPTSTTAYSLAPALLTNASTLYAPTSVPGSVSRVPSLLTNTSTLYNPTSAATYSVQPSLYSNTPTFYTPSVAFDLRVQISWIEITPIQGVNIAPLLLSNGNTLYAPTSSVGPVSRTPDLLTNTSVLYAPTTALTYSLTPALLSDGDTFYTPTVYTFGSLAPALLTNTSVLYTPTRTTGPVSRTPALLTNTSVLYTPTTVYVVPPALLTNSNAHYAPTVRPTTAVAPALLTNTSTLYAPTRSATVSVAPALLNNSSTLYTPTRSTTVSVAPALLTDGDTLYTPVVSDIKLVAPALLTNSSVVYVPTRTAGPASRQPDLLGNASALYVPGRTTGPVSRAPALYVDPDVIPAPIVTAGQQRSPALLSNTSNLYPASSSASYSIYFADYVVSGYWDPDYSSTVGVSSNTFFSPTIGGLYSAYIDSLVNGSNIYAPFAFFPGIPSALVVVLGPPLKSVSVDAGPPAAAAIRDTVGVDVPAYEKGVHVPTA